MPTKRAAERPFAGGKGGAVATTKSAQKGSIDGFRILATSYWRCGRRGLPSARYFNPRLSN